MIGIVLGSGLGPLADTVVVEREVPFADAGLPVSSVPGHAGKFVFGKLGGTPVVLMKGRVHLYEGHGARGSSRPACAGWRSRGFKKSSSPTPPAP